MKEFNFVVSEAMANGMATYTAMPFNAPYLYSCVNLKPSSRGLVRFDPPEFSVWSETANPFIFTACGRVFMCYEDSIEYVLDEEDDLLSAIPTVIDLDEAELSGSTDWSYGVIGKLVLICNGTDLILIAIGDEADSVVVSEEAGAIAVCATRDRFVIAGAVNELPEDAIWWSSILGYDEVLDQLGGEADTDSLNTLLFGNQSGVYRTNSPVHTLRPLGYGFAAYGDVGAIVFSHVSEPVATFSVKTTTVPAVIKATGGDTGNICYCNDGMFYAISHDGTAKEIGDVSAIDGDIYASYDETTGDMWFTYGDESRESIVFVGSGGVCKSTLAPLCVARDIKSRLIVVTDRVEPVSFEVQFGPFDVSDKGRKKITCMQLSVVGAQNMVVRPGVRYDVNSDFQYVKQVGFNPQGVAFVNTSFSEILLKLTGYFTGSYKTFCMSRAEIRYNNEDLKFRRGTKGVEQ